MRFFTRGDRSGRGQALVESAIILPSMTFLVLGILQLTMLQHAQLMTEYAAFQACRAGIVWNGNHDKMKSAARLSLTPTIIQGGIVPAGGGAIRQGNQGLADVLIKTETLRGLNAIAGLAGMEMIRVETVHPNRSEFNSFKASAQFSGGSTHEMEFDDVGYWTGSGDSGGKDGFFGNANYRKAMLLTIRIRYLYEMRIPFADRVIQMCWLAANAPKLLALHGQIGNEAISAPLNAQNAVTAGDFDTTGDLEAASAAVISPGAGNGKPIITKAEYIALYAAGRAEGWFLFPLVATYTMRMQSNFFEANLE